MIAGVEVAVAHIAKILDQAGIQSSDAIAQSYREMAQNVSPTMANKEQVAMILNHIATILETSSPKDFSSEIRQMLH